MASTMCPRAIHTRTVATKTPRISITKATRSPLSTATRASSRTPFRTQASRPQPCITTRRHVPTHNAPTSSLLIRPNSSTSAPTNANTTSEDVLTWDRFFNLRRRRRFLNLGSSAITSLTAVGICGPIIAQQDLDAWAAQVSGLDPIIMLGITTFAVAAGGWLCGPTFGGALFKLWAGRKGWNAPIAEKEKSFFARIRRYRADPSSSSPQNPIPDYYGEKIASVKDYRRWLKDQRAFNLKKNKNML